MTIERKIRVEPSAKQDVPHRVSFIKTKPQKYYHKVLQYFVCFDNFLHFSLSFSRVSAWQNRGKPCVVILLYLQHARGRPSVVLILRNGDRRRHTKVESLSCGEFARTTGETTRRPPTRVMFFAVVLRGFLSFFFFFLRYFYIEPQNTTAAAAATADRAVFVVNKSLLDPRIRPSPLPSRRHL